MFKCVYVYEHLSGIIFFSVALLFLFFLLISLLGRCTLELKISTKDYMNLRQIVPIANVFYTFFL